MSPPEAVAAFAFFGGMFWVLRPVAAAIAKRIAGEHRRPAVESEDREQILAELQQMQHQLAELAERMDFAERLLAKPRDARAP